MEFYWNRIAYRFGTNKYPASKRLFFVINYTLVFDEVIVSQLKKLGEDKGTRILLSKMFDKLEVMGSRAGELIDSQLGIYEIKSKHPPIRLYFRHNKQNNEIHIFEYEMKTSSNKQERTIRRVCFKASQTKSQYPPG